MLKISLIISSLLFVLVQGQNAALTICNEDDLNEDLLIVCSELRRHQNGAQKGKGWEI